MTGTRTLAELLRALSVLALLFLNFAHQPAFAAPTAADALSVVASQSFCGTPIADDDHVPCHACRIGSGADLPPVMALPAVPLPVTIRLTGSPQAFCLARIAPLQAGARAPPAA